MNFKETRLRLLTSEDPGEILDILDGIPLKFHEVGTSPDGHDAA
jgi:hypothetical protein